MPERPPAALVDPVERRLTGTMLDGTPVLVTVFRDGDAELSLQRGDGYWETRWDIPILLREQL